MNSLSRFFHVTKKLLPLLFVLAISKNNTDSQDYRNTIVKIRLAFQNLGVTYIKLGQMLSARPDLVGPKLADELRNLLDSETPMSFNNVKAIVEHELGKPLKEVFTFFDQTPIATASIGQVHKATIHNRTHIAVKIQRTGIEEIIKKDLEVFRHVTNLGDFIIAKKGFKLSYIYKEFSDWITNELDFTVEAKRAEKFGENMKDLEGIRIPKVYWELTTSKVLTTSFLEGFTVNHIISEMKRQHALTAQDIKLPFKVNVELVIERAVNSLVKQLLVDKFFHGDMHPANLIVGKGNTVGFVDFGIVGTVDTREHTQFIMMLLAFIDDDPQSLTKVMLQFCSNPLSHSDVQLMYQNFSDELRTLHESAAGKMSISHLIMLLLGLAAKYDLILSPGLLLGAKTISQIDSISHELGVKESIVDILKPSVEKYISSSFTVDFSKEMLFKNILNLIEGGKRLPETLADLERLVAGGEQIETSMAAFSPAVSQPSAIKHTFSVVAALAISVPIVTQPIISQSSFRIILILATPLLLYGILVRIVKA